MIRFAFIFLAPGADSKRQRALIETPMLSFTVVATKDLDDAIRIAGNLAEEGVQVMELCGGFGPVGTAKIIATVGDKVPVGEVYYGVESMSKLLNILGEMGKEA